MKIQKWAIGILPALTIMFASSMSHASALDISGSGNGGDICEDRFKVIRDDLELWIQNGGSKDLVLPSGHDVAEYNKSMLSQIQMVKKISCTEDKVLVGQTEKTCRNSVDDDGVPQILCNVNRFNDTPPSDQYVLVHHEYAGLAQLEVPNGDSSTYIISNQISDFLVDVQVKKLAVRPRSTTITCQQNGFEEQKTDLSGFSLTTAGRKLSFSFTIPAHSSDPRDSFRLHDSLVDNFPNLKGYVRKDHAYEINYVLEIPGDYNETYCRPFSHDRALGFCQIDIGTLPESQRLMTIVDRTERHAPVSFSFDAGAFGVSMHIDDNGFQTPGRFFGVATNFNGFQLQNRFGRMDFHEKKCQITYQ